MLYPPFSVHGSGIQSSERDQVWRWNVDLETDWMSVNETPEMMWMSYPNRHSSVSYWVVWSLFSKKRVRSKTVKRPVQCKPGIEKSSVMFPNVRPRSVGDFLLLLPLGVVGAGSFY